MMQSFTESDKFDEAFKKMANTNEKFIVIFTGSNKEGTNESWCPDCVVANPTIKKLIDAGTRPVLHGIVTPKEWLGNASHPYRTNYQAAGVPTVILYKGNTALHRVDDLKDFSNEQTMSRFLKD